MHLHHRMTSFLDADVRRLIYLGPHEAVEGSRPGKGAESIDDRQEGGTAVERFNMVPHPLPQCDKYLSFELEGTLGGAVDLRLDGNQLIGGIPLTSDQDCRRIKWSGTLSRLLLVISKK